MTDTIEQKALALVNAEQAKSGCLPIGAYHGPCMKALHRAIEQHEAFRQEVSDAVEQYWASLSGAFVAKPPPYMARFIIAKPDPLVAAVTDVWPASCDEHVNELRAAIEKRGGRIVFDGSGA